MVNNLLQQLRDLEENAFSNPNLYCVTLKIMDNKARIVMSDGDFSVDYKISPEAYKAILTNYVGETRTYIGGFHFKKGENAKNLMEESTSTIKAADFKALLLRTSRYLIIDGFSLCDSK